MSNKYFRSVKGILESPRPLELISMDTIGPRPWKDGKFYVYCIVDHCTRYMFNIVTKKQDAITATAALRTYIGLFGVPQAVLTDNGSEYEQRFDEYVRGELRTKLMKTSVYYPEGNGINKSSHQTIKSLIASQVLCAKTLPFEEMVKNITMVYNATPHGNLGVSPYFALFGQELMLPGWQELKSHSQKHEAKANNTAFRISQALNALLRNFQSLKDVKVDQEMCVGDWVQFKLSEYEKNTKSGSAAITSATAYQPKASVPYKIISIKDKQAVLQRLGNPKGEVRKAPLVHMRKLPTVIPESLARLTVENLVVEQPRLQNKYKKLPAHRMVAMDDLMDRLTENVHMCYIIDLEDGVSQVQKEEEIPITSIICRQHESIPDKKVRSHGLSLNETANKRNLKNFLPNIVKRTRQRIRQSKLTPEQSVRRAQPY